MADFRFSSAAARLRRSEIRELLKLTRTPGTISFGGGLPDPSIFPLAAVEAATIRALRERGNLALQYSPTEGEPALKVEISNFMARMGDPASTEEMMVVSASQQALDLLGRVFIDRGDAIIVERPSYLGAIQAFRGYGADFHGVEMDADGVIPNRLERQVIDLLARGNKPKFVYLIPDFQNPSGVNLSLGRREEILTIASEYDLLIIEDSPYRELRFTGELIPSLRALDREGRVVQLKTFSKIFSPGFRLGWVVAPAPVLDKLVMAKQAADLCTSAFVSLVSAYLLQEGHIERQIEIGRRLYARKVRVMLDALSRHMPDVDGLTWSQPEGGVFLWLRLPEYMDTFEMIGDAVREKVAYVVGTCFYYDDAGRNEMRLNYSYPTETQIEEGIVRLARIVRARVRKSRPKVQAQGLPEVSRA